jgi:acyl-CoA thioester hydrolase
MAEPFRVRLAARSYEIDARGHLSAIAYYQYAEHARWSLLLGAGISEAQLLAQRVSPVNLETTMRFRREVRAEDEVDVSCAFTWGEGKSFRVQQDFRLADGTVAAELSNVGGLLDLDTRRLAPRPGERFRALAAAPQLLGL